MASTIASALHSCMARGDNASFPSTSHNPHDLLFVQEPLQIDLVILVMHKHISNASSMDMYDDHGGIAQVVWL